MFLREEECRKCSREYTQHTLYSIQIQTNKHLFTIFFFIFANEETATTTTTPRKIYVTNKKKKKRNNVLCVSPKVFY